MFPANSQANALPFGLGGFQPGGNEEESGSGSGAERARKIERSITYMTQHLNQPVCVAELAAQASVSPSHFFALFKRRTGSAPMDYFTRLRMRQAGRLLGETLASVKEVAALLGYDDPFYFSRVFKSVHGVPPSCYRTAKSNDGSGADAAGLPPATSKESLMPA